MKQAKKRNKWGDPFLYIYICLLLFVVFVTVMGAVKKEGLCVWWTICSGLATAGMSIITFAKGLFAQARQNELLNKVFDIISNNGNRLSEDVTERLEDCRAYAHVVLYAMYQSKQCGRSFNYKKIDPKYPEIVKLIIFTILSVFKSKDLLCYIGDDDALVVQTFNQKITQTITDGQELINKYEHFKIGKTVKACVKRINKACGIDAKYSS